MKATLFVTIYIALIYIVKNQSTGLRIGVKSHLIDEIKEQFLPSVISNYQNFSIPDQSLDFNMLVTNLSLNITEVNIRIINFSADNLEI
jgi:hypothetical protein